MGRQHQRCILKLGTSVVTLEGRGIALKRLRNLVMQVCELTNEGHEFLLVSSGAVSLGAQALELSGSLGLAKKQACAAVGQRLLMDEYQKLFTPLNKVVAQILVTANDLADRRRYLNLRDTLEELLKMGVVPIINENDTVSTMELTSTDSSNRFGDNDKLSALVASKLGADLLILLSDIQGFFDENPKKKPNATRIPAISSLDEFSNIQDGGKSKQGRGGISSKIEACRIASISGISSVVASGFDSSILRNLFSHQGKDFGSWVHPVGKLSGKRKWLGFSSDVFGVIIINEGAKQALTENFASLLPSGVTDVTGQFAAGQVVSVQDKHQNEIGRGICSFSDRDISKIKGLHSRQVADVLKGAETEEVIHRNNLIIFKEGHHQ